MASGRSATHRGQLGLAMVLTALALGALVFSFGAGAGAQATVSVDLCATTGTQTMFDGSTVPIWGYTLGDCTTTGDATFPAPVLRGNLGDTMDITLHVDPAMPEGVTVDVIGLGSPSDPGAVLPGAAATFSFSLDREGTFLYESDADSTHVLMGLSGALVVDPAGGPGSAHGQSYASEALMVLRDVDPALNALVAGSGSGAVNLLDYHPRYFLLNGRSHDGLTPSATMPDLGAAAGSDLLLRYVNASPEDAAMATLGVRQSIIGRNGDDRLDRDGTVIYLTSGQTADAVVTLPASGGRFAVMNRTLRSTNLGGTPDGIGSQLVFIDSGAALLAGELRVTTSPAVPATITFAGDQRSQWGIDWLDMPATTGELCFSDVPGFVTPPCEQVTNAAGVTTVAQGDFTPVAMLSVSTLISGGTAGVPSVITINGTPAATWGINVELPPGSTEICFGPVAGYSAPPCETVVLESGIVSTVQGVFTADAAAPGPVGPVGLLRVTTSPAVPSTILVNGNPVSQWSVEWVPHTPGPMEVCFTDVPGFTTPACEQVVLVDGATTVVSGVFEAQGGIRATTSPAQDVVVTVDGIPRNQWGLWAMTAPGNYSVCAEFPTGDVCRGAAVTASAQTDVVLVEGGGGGGGGPTPTPTPTPTPPPAPSGALVSVTASSVSPSLAVGSAEDLFRWDGATLSVELDLSVLGLAGADIDAAHYDAATDSYLLSFADSFPNPGGAAWAAVAAATIEDADIIEFRPTAIGPDVTAGTFHMYLAGSTGGLTTPDEDVDAIAILDGSLVISTRGTAEVPDGAGGFVASDADLLAWEPASGTWSVYFDGSDLDGVDNAFVHDIDALDDAPFGAFDLSIDVDYSFTDPNAITATAATAVRCAMPAFVLPLHECTALSSLAELGTVLGGDVDALTATP